VRDKGDWPQPQLGDDGVHVADLVVGGIRVASWLIRFAPPTRFTANPRQPNRRAIRQVTSKIGAVETDVPKKSRAMSTGDGSSGTWHKRCASPTGMITQSPSPAAAAPPANAPAKCR
jgi:hypothetical protein